MDDSSQLIWTKDRCYCSRVWVFISFRRCVIKVGQRNLALEARFHRLWPVCSVKRTGPTGQLHERKVKINQISKGVDEMSNLTTQLQCMIWELLSTVNVRDIGKFI